MRAAADWLHRTPDGALVLRIRVRPHGSRTGVDGVRDGRLQVRVAAPPVDGAANQALLRWLAREFATAPSRLQLEAGSTARDKRVRVQGQRREPDWLLALSDTRWRR